MTWRKQTLVAAALMVAAGACSSTDTAAPPQQSTAQPTADAPTTSTTAAPTTSSTAAPTTTTAPTTTESPEPEPTEVEAAIKAAITRYWEAVILANDPPNPESEIWDEIATPEAAAKLRATSSELASARQGVRQLPDGPWGVLEIKLLSVDASRALISICLGDSNELYDLETGERIDSTSFVSWFQHVLLFTDERWLVDESTHIENFWDKDECVAAF